MSSTVDGYQLRLEDALAPGPFRVHGGTVHHPLLAPGAIHARPYQTSLARAALRENHLLVLPTGLGKTIVAALAAAETLRRHPQGQVVVLAPTRPLVLQHARTFRGMLKPEVAEASTVLTGHLPPPRRADAFRASRLVFSTPQGLANDVAAGRARLDRVALMVFDEAHRTVGDYAYVPLARALRDHVPHARTLGLTASPGHRRPRVREVIANLGATAVESRTAASEDVAPYAAGVRVEVERVPLDPALDDARRCLQAAVDARAETLRRMGFLTRAGDTVGKRALLACGDAIRRRLAVRASGFLFGALHQQLVAVHTLHALELLESQGVHAFRSYVERKGEEEARSAKAFLKDERVAAAQAILTGRSHHPKENALRAALAAFRDAGGERCIVFAQYRDTVHRLEDLLAEEGFRAAAFIGQAGDDGLTQDEQEARVAALRRGDLDALVATSIGEEGVDIPAVDLVVFFEPVPSEIRAIQRRGRTGRTRFGRVVVLVSADTRDEGWLSAQEQKEREMRRLVEGL